MLRTLRYTSLVLLIASTTLAQQAPAAKPAAEEPGKARPGEIALAPSRFELPMARGEEKTVVVNVISSGGDTGGKSIRLLASLGDWTMTPEGQVAFAKPGTTARSAADWMVYSPVELTVTPGKTHPIRVTISVPDDAPPGDHLAVLFVEERPAENKTRTNVKQLVFHFRLAAIFYIMVSPHTMKGSLVNLTTALGEKGLAITPTLKNEGDTHLRPLQSFQLLDAAGKVVAEQAPTETSPILGGLTLAMPLTLSEPIAPGEYSLRYRVDFKDGSKVTEGRTKVVIPAADAKPTPVKGSTPARRK